MNIIDLIEKKKQKQSLNQEEIEYFVNGYLNGEIEDYQASALLMAIYFVGMDLDETTYLTKAMVDSGEVLDLSCLGEFVIDKHSSGGVGDKITMMFMPLVASLGDFKVAKLSGRGLGHTGGTIDKFEAIPNFDVNLSDERFLSQVKEINLALASQTKTLAPADGKIYALRDVTSTVNIIPLIASSIVSKKIASGANFIVLDVKYGSGAFIKTKEEALTLAKTMVEVGKRLNRSIIACITDMNMPLGHAVGNSLEVIEAIEFLKGNMPNDLKEITYALITTILYKTNKFKTKDEIERLIAGEIIVKEIRQELTYSELDRSIDNLWSALFTTGYLTQRGTVGDDKYCLTIPNYEIRKLFIRQIKEWFSQKTRNDGKTLEQFCDAFEDGNTVLIEKLFNDYLWNTISIQDTASQDDRKENFYHGLLLGLLGYKDDWLVKSNAESGIGYSDILIEIRENRIGIVVEMKYAANGKLEAACQEALSQIEDRKYEARLKEDGMKKVEENEKIILDGFNDTELCLLRRFLEQITENIEKIPVSSGKNNTEKERQQK